MRPWNRIILTRDAGRSISVFVAATVLRAKAMLVIVSWCAKCWFCLPELSKVSRLLPSSIWF